jgi:hypothetical protein
MQKDNTRRYALTEKAHYFEISLCCESGYNMVLSVHPDGDVLVMGGKPVDGTTEGGDTLFAYDGSAFGENGDGWQHKRLSEIPGVPLFYAAEKVAESGEISGLYAMVMLMEMQEAERSFFSERHICFPHHLDASETPHHHYEPNVVPPVL